MHKVTKNDSLANIEMVEIKGERLHGGNVYTSIRQRKESILKREYSREDDKGQNWEASTLSKLVSQLERRKERV